MYPPVLEGDVRSMDTTEVLAGTWSETVRLSMATDDGEVVRIDVNVKLRE